MMTSAPNASIIRFRSGELPADMKAIKGCPSAAQTTASPAPIFPLVHSVTGYPGFRVPFSLAPRTTAKAARSLTLPPG